MIELFRSDNLLVRCLPSKDTSRWVITFDNYGIGHGFERPGFGEEFLKTAGVSAIHIMGAREDWYQYPEIFDALAAVRGHVAGAQRVMTYGSSMGGYAALRFAEGVGANAALALSPQYCIDPNKAPFEERWRQDGLRIKWLPETERPLSLNFMPVVVYDPHIEDAKHMALIARDMEVAAIKLPFSGHPSSTSLAEMGLLKTLVLQTLSGELNLKTFRKQIRSARRKSTNYLARLAGAQPAHRHKTGMALAKMGIALAPNNRLGAMGMARVQTKAGHIDAAIATLRPFLSNIETEHPYYVHFADLLVEGGHYEEALDIADEVSRSQPDWVHLWAWKAHFLWLNNRVPEAIALVSKALERDPAHAHYATSLQTYRETLILGDPRPPVPRLPPPEPRPPLTGLKLQIRRLERFIGVATFSRFGRPPA